MVAEANYGGRVTDDKDRRLIKIILEGIIIDLLIFNNHRFINMFNLIIIDFYNANALDESYKYSESGTYYCPPDGPFDDYKNFIKELPLNDKPEVFGLHDNA
jgi:dynein heavy chain, axonemal